jgi:hypothetical protein
MTVVTRAANKATASCLNSLGVLIAATLGFSSREPLCRASISLPLSILVLGTSRANRRSPMVDCTGDAVC